MSVISLLVAAQPEEAERRALVLAAERQLFMFATVPSLAEVADLAGLSGDAPSRWFPSQASLLLEAALLTGLPDSAAVLDGTDAADVSDRVEQAAMLTYRNVCVRARALPFAVLERVVALVLDAGDCRSLSPAFVVPLIDDALQPIEEPLGPLLMQQLRRSLSILVVSQALRVARGRDELRRQRTAADLAWACRALVLGALV